MWSSNTRVQSVLEAEKWMNLHQFCLACKFSFNLSIHGMLHDIQNMNAVIYSIYTVQNLSIANTCWSTYTMQEKENNFHKFCKNERKFMKNCIQKISTVCILKAENQSLLLRMDVMAQLRENITDASSEAELKWDHRKLIIVLKLAQARNSSCSETFSETSALAALAW